MLLGTLLRDTKEGPKLLSLELAGIASPACGYSGRADTHIGPSPPLARSIFTYGTSMFGGAGGVPLWACMAGMWRSQRSAQAEAAPRHPRFLPTR